MTIGCKKNEVELPISLTVLPDPAAALQLNEAVEEQVGGVTSLIFDFAVPEHSSFVGSL